MYPIFKDFELPKINKEEYEKLIVYYKNNLKWIQIIYKQNVIKSEP